MKGANADDCANRIKAPSSARATAMGISQNFLRLRRNSQRSSKRSNIRKVFPCGPAAGPHGKTFLMFDLFEDLWLFLRSRKKFWLMPIAVALALLGALILFAQSSALAPFIY